MAKKNEFPGYLMPTLHQKYYHVYSELEKLWGTDRFNDYTNKLMATDRVMRTAFDKVVLMEIVAVKNLYATQFPTAAFDVWSHTFAR